MSNKSETSELSFVRRLFWPVYPQETQKVLIMMAMLAIALFNYTCLRIIKDSIVLDAAGKDALPFLKGFCVLPATLFFVKKFWDLSDAVSRKNLFYFTLAPFLIFFIVFSFLIYPFSSYLHASHATIAAWQGAYPRFKGIIAICGNWSYGLFYVCAELWGNVVVTLLFWNFANSVFSREQASRIFPIFASYANVGLIAGGLVTAYFTKLSIASKIAQKNAKQALEVVGIDSTTTVLLLLVVTGVMLAVLYWFLNESVLAKEGFDINACSVKKKAKMSLVESIKFLCSSKYLIYVSILVLSYGMTANLVEVTWKGLVKDMCGDKDQVTLFMCNFFLLTGVATSFLGFCTKGVVTRFGWLVGSLITPVIMIITSVAFYVFILFKQYLPAAVIASSVLYAVVIGAIQNILSKSAKYNLFDPTVQMAYIPLEEGLRVKGKAAVDVIGGRAGKAFSSYLQTAVIAIFALENMQRGVYMVLVVGLCVAWIYATIALSKEYYSLSVEQDRNEALAAKKNAEGTK